MIPIGQKNSKDRINKGRVPRYVIWLLAAVHTKSMLKSIYSDDLSCLWINPIDFRREILAIENVSMFGTKVTLEIHAKFSFLSAPP